MTLCIFTVACRIDWVLIVFPGVLEGSAMGIDQPFDEATCAPSHTQTVTLVQADRNEGAQNETESKTCHLRRERCPSLLGKKAEREEAGAGLGDV